VKQVLWSFGPFEVDEARYELRRDGQSLPLRRKVFDVLHYLVRNSDRLVSKDELLRNVWPGETIHEGVLPQNISTLRKLLGDSRGDGKIIHTVHGRGYRFMETVRRNPASVRPAAGTAPPGSPTLVGRQRVLSELFALLDESLQQRGRLVLITGEAGIGKTRVTEELIAESRARAVLVLESRCVDDEGAPAYWPWIQVLRAAAAGAVDERKASVELAQLLSASPHKQSENSALVLKDPAQARFRLFDAVTTYLARLSHTRPIVIVFDDLHWADEASLLLMRFVAKELKSLPLLVLGTCREPDAQTDPRVAGYLLPLASDPHVLRIYLRGLSTEETRLFAAQTSALPLDEGELRELHSLTEGSPFFIQEVLRLFDNDAQRIVLPSRAREIIALRLRGLPDEAVQTLRIASVTGSALRLPVLEAITGRSRQELLQILSLCLRARIVREVETSADGVVSHGYAFAHALIRETLYSALPEPQRVSLHAQVGSALEAIVGVDVEPHLTELAHHFHRAASGGDVERAVQYCALAAEQATASLAFERAVVHYRAALESLASALPIDEKRRFALKLALGSSLFRAGEDGNPMFLGAAEIARRLGDAELLAQVVLAMRGWPREGYRGRTFNRELGPLLAEALAALPAGRPALRARLLATSAFNRPPEVTSTVAALVSQEALDLARESGDSEALYDALHARLRLMHAPEDISLRLQLVAELVRMAERSGERERVFTARGLRIQPLLALGDLSAADEEIARCSALATELRPQGFERSVLRFAIERALGDGRFDEVGGLTEQVVAATGPGRRTPLYFAGVLIWAFYERVWRGDFASVEGDVAWMATRTHGVPLFWSLVAFTRALSGKFDEARPWYEPLVRPDFLDAARDDNWLTTVVHLADAIVLCQDRRAAAELYPRLLPLVTLNVTHPEMMVYFGSCALWLGMLAELLGDRAVALAHFEAALAMNTRLGARPATARTELAYARTLLHRGHVEDRERARSLLGQALEKAAQLRMPWIAEEARKLLD
jgi:DNA-binding winged helix-turn-helix (wHTH) protein/tetratricopeptide (TPR) repeat protein